MVCKCFMSTFITSFTVPFIQFIFSVCCDILLELCMYEDRKVNTFDKNLFLVKQYVDHIKFCLEGHAISVFALLYPGQKKQNKTKTNRKMELYIITHFKFGDVFKLF